MTPDFSNEYTVIYYGPTETHRKGLWSIFAGQTTQIIDAVDDLLKLSAVLRSHQQWVDYKRSRRPGQRVEPFRSWRKPEARPRFYVLPHPYYSMTHCVIDRTHPHCNAMKGSVSWHTTEADATRVCAALNAMEGAGE